MEKHLGEVRRVSVVEANRVDPTGPPRRFDRSRDGPGAAVLPRLRRDVLLPTFGEHERVHPEFGLRALPEDGASDVLGLGRDVEINTRAYSGRLRRDVELETVRGAPARKNEVVDPETSFAQSLLVREAEDDPDPPRPCFLPRLKRNAVGPHPVHRLAPEFEKGLLVAEPSATRSQRNELHVERSICHLEPQRELESQSVR